MVIGHNCYVGRATRPDLGGPGPDGGCRLIARKVLLLMPFLMSPADALFLLAERPERPLHVGTLALLNPPEGTDGWDLREMVAAAQARERVAPLWRRRPHRSLRERAVIR